MGSVQSMYIMPQCHCTCSCQLGIYNVHAYIWYIYIHVHVHLYICVYICTYIYNVVSARQVEKTALQGSLARFLGGLRGGGGAFRPP